jgi:hypothetical protein
MRGVNMRIGDLLELVSGSFLGLITTPALSANRNYNFPDKSGTVALLDDLNNYSEVLNENSSFTLALSDAGKFIVSTVTTDITVTVPSDGTINFPIGTEIEFFQDNTGKILFSSSTGVNIRTEGSNNSTGFQTLSRYSIASLKKIAGNEWRLFGSVTW